ncbi:hypothetical protein JYT50_00215 [bacterium AH-315-A23]|nr:hypothetical protein [bacterium AH-315-A23]
MSVFYEYIILEEIKLIIEFYQGDITLRGMKNMKRNLFQDKYYNAEYKILSDLRLSKNSLTIEEAEDYGAWVGEKLKSLGSSSQAILTSTPQQVVQSLIYSSNVNFKNNNCKVFSTLEGVLNFLSIDISNIEVIKNEINKIKFKQPIVSVF